MVHQKSIIGALPFLVAGVAASPISLIEFLQQATCGLDGLFLCFLDPSYAAPAASYCSALPPSTTTVATETATTTSTVWTGVVVTTLTDTVTSTTTVFTTTVPSATATVTGYYGESPQKMKRAESVPPPPCLAAYPASRITAYCSCIQVPVRTTSVTYTAGTVTVTDTSTSLLTASTTETVWETVSTATTGGVATATVPPVRGANLDFELDNLNDWSYYTNFASNWAASAVSVTGADGQPTKAFRVTNSGNSGFAQLRYQNPFHLRPGSPYRVSLSGKTTTSGAGNSLPNMQLSIVTLSGSQILVTWAPMQNGVALGNGWYRFSGDFTPPAQSDGYYTINVYYSRNANLVEHFVDNFAMDKI